MTEQHAPPMDPGTDEADARQLDIARAQGEAFGRALAHMVGEVAQGGGSATHGHYEIGWAVEEAEGMYEWVDDGLEWREPGDANAHIEIAVRDASDGRLVPAVRVVVTVLTSDGTEIGTHEHPLLWHPMIYHYGRNWTLPGDGEYTLRVHVDPPRFLRHDEVNGRRFTEPADVEFTGVRVETGRD